jgi:hypothetical protein
MARIDIKEGASPGTPGVGYGRIYVDTSGNLHLINDIGVDGIIWATPGRRQTVTIKAATYDLTPSDEVVIFTANATANLPSATGSGQTYRIYCRAGVLSVEGYASDTVCGAANKAVAVGAYLIITDVATGAWE